MAREMWSVHSCCGGGGNGEPGHGQEGAGEPGTVETTVIRARTSVTALPHVPLLPS